MTKDKPPASTREQTSTDSKEFFLLYLASVFWHGVNVLRFKPNWIRIKEKEESFLMVLPLFIFFLVFEGAVSLYLAKGSSIASVVISFALSLALPFLLKAVTGYRLATMFCCYFITAKTIFSMLLMIGFASIHIFIAIHLVYCFFLPFDYRRRFGAH